MRAFFVFPKKNSWLSILVSVLYVYGKETTIYFIIVVSFFFIGRDSYGTIFF